jgi:hypothetical protein
MYHVFLNKMEEIYSSSSHFTPLKLIRVLHIIYRSVERMTSRRAYLLWIQQPRETTLNHFLPLYTRNIHWDAPQISSLFWCLIVCCGRAGVWVCVGESEGWPLSTCCWHTVLLTAESSVLVHHVPLVLSLSPSLTHSLMHACTNSLNHSL